MKTSDIKELTVYAIGPRGRWYPDAGIVLTTEPWELTCDPYYRNPDTYRPAPNGKGRGATPRSTSRGLLTIRVIAPERHERHEASIAALPEIASAVLAHLTEHGTAPDLSSDFHLSVTRPQEITCTWAQHLADRESDLVADDLREQRRDALHREEMAAHARLTAVIGDTPSPPRQDGRSLRTSWVELLALCEAYHIAKTTTTTASETTP